MSESINRVLKDYLESPKTDYAIMISGEWGCGKTHYIHNGFVDMVKSVACPNGKGHDKGDQFYKPAFISLYGVSSAEDFEYRVFCGINSWAEKGFIRLGSTLLKKGAGFWGIEFSKKDTSLVTVVRDNRVLVFDDLERICEDKIPVKEVLGLINSYAEHTHRKVIIVCNEDEFSGNKGTNENDDKRADNAIKSEDYKKYKEKSVRFTYKFTPNIELVYDAMVKEKPDGVYKQYLVKEKVSILTLFRLGGERNLRTLKFFIDTFEKILLAVHDVEYWDQIVRICLVSFMLYVCEHKRGHLAKDLETLDFSRYKIDSSAFLNVYPNKQDEKQHKDYASEFQERYSDVYGEFKPCRLFIDYIETGYLDVNGLESEIEVIDKDLKRKVVTKEGRVYQKLQRMSELEDKDVVPLIEEMMSYVSTDKYNLYDLLNVYALLLKYDYWSIGGFELTEAIDDKFKASMDRQKDRHIFNALFEVHTPIWDYSDRDSRQFKKYDTIKKEAMRINWQAKQKADGAEGQKFLAIAESGEVERLRQLRKDPDHRTPVSGIDWKRVMDLIIDAPNPVACEVCNCIMFFMPGSGCLNPLERERVEKELIPAIEKYLGQKGNLLRRVYVEELRNHLTEVIR